MPAHRSKRRCTLAGIKAHLNPPQAGKTAVQPAGAVVDPAAKPSYRFRAMIVTGAALVLFLIFAAFKFGWDLTPSSPMPAPQPPVLEPTAEPAPTAATAPAPSAAPTAEPAPTAATALAPSAAPTAEPTPTPAPAAEPPKGGVVKGSVAHQALPDIPTKIIGAIQGHLKVSIRVEVDPEGNVSQASIDSPGPSRYFANQALHAAQSWKFTPAQVDGRAAVSTWLLQFQFGQSQSAVTPTEESP